MIEKGHGRPRGSEERPMDSRVEVRLTKPDGTAVLSWQKVLDHISANQLYHDLVAGVTERYPPHAVRISCARMAVPPCLLAPRHCAIVVLAVDVAPFTTLVRRMARVLPGRRLAACSLAPESARP